MFFDPSSTPAGACDTLHSIPSDCMSAPWPLAIGVALLIVCALGHEWSKDLRRHLQRKRDERSKRRGNMA